MKLQAMGIRLKEGLASVGVLITLLSGCSAGGGSDKEAKPQADQRILAASCTFMDVAAAISSAASGDTVVVPAGSCAWGSSLLITKGLILTGAGVGSTVITNTSADGDNMPLIEYRPSNPAANQLFEVSGFTFDGNDASALLDISSNSDMVAISNFKIHDNKFQNARSRAISLLGLEFGVFYNNQYLNNLIGIWVGSSEQNGWNYPITQGGANYPYFENETFVETIARGGFISETGRGGRLVIRYSTVTGYGGSGGEVHDQHGVNADYSSGGRGTVGSEFYNNTINTDASSRILHHRGGKAIVFNVTVTGAGGYIEMTEYQGWSYCQTTTWPAPNQVNSAYYWNNTLTPFLLHPTGGNCGSFNDSFFIQLNRDYWLPTAGLDTSRPSTCTIGDKYGATDTGKLYSCDATDFWTLQYTPYTYPHPLR